MILLISFLLALIPLAGIVWILVFSSVTTVDGLFMSLILLAIAAMLGGNVLFELRKWRRRAGLPAGAKQPSAAAYAGELIQRGKVASVQFFEAHVGQPNKSIVTFAESADPGQMLVFEGDLRNALPTGQKVAITFRKATGYNVLLNVSYS
jgi:hypothetical protein